MSTTAAARPLSPLQDQLLASLASHGGACAFGSLSRVAFGIAPGQLPAGERARLNASLRWLEQRGLLTIERKWGTGGYGQPTLIRLTDRGQSYAAEVSAN